MTETVKNFVRRDHALVSPSSLFRIISCTPSLKINEDYRLEHGETTSAAAMEGTTAHAVAENLVNEHFNIPLQPASIEEAAQADFTMKVCGEAYKNFIVRLFQGGNYLGIRTEKLVDMRKYISECWGTCDCFLISRDTLTVVDYKYGHALVSAKGNNQLRAYALGAYLLLPERLQKSITKVSFFIFQPRATTEYSGRFPRKLETVGAISNDDMTVTELISWAKEINVKVEQALKNEGEYVAGEHCAFCAGRGTCPRTREYPAEETEISSYNISDLFMNNGI